MEDGGEEDGGLRESVPRRPPPVSSSMLDTPRTIGEERRDPELVHLEMQLDMWCTDMKRNIIVSIYRYNCNECTYVCTYVSRLVIPSLKIKGTDWSTFAMYWGTTLTLLVMYPGFLSDSY